MSDYDYEGEFSPGQIQELAAVLNARDKANQEAALAAADTINWQRTHEIKQAIVEQNYAAAAKQLSSELGVAQWNSFADLFNEDEQLQAQMQRMSGDGQSPETVEGAFRTLFDAAKGRGQITKVSDQAIQDRQDWERIKNAPGSKSYADLMARGQITRPDEQ